MERHVLRPMMTAFLRAIAASGGFVSAAADAEAVAAAPAATDVEAGGEEASNVAAAAVGLGSVDAADGEECSSAATIGAAVAPAAPAPPAAGITAAGAMELLPSARPAATPEPLTAAVALAWPMTGAPLTLLVMALKRAISAGRCHGSAPPLPMPQRGTVAATTTSTGRNDILVACGAHSGREGCNG